MAEAVARARRAGGPTFIEALTVRWPGSRPLWPQLLTGATDLTYAWDASAIPADYAVWHTEQDGLLRYVRELLSAGVLTAGEVLAMDGAVRDQMDGAIRFALDSPYPPETSAFESVYA